MSKGLKWIETTDVTNRPHQYQEILVYREDDYGAISVSRDVFYGTFNVNDKFWMEMPRVYTNEGCTENYLSSTFIHNTIGTARTNLRMKMLDKTLPDRDYIACGFAIKELDRLYSKLLCDW